ncbi:Gfo/Idh/MocA family protein [Pirellulaceae bacterium SH467]
MSSELVSCRWGILSAASIAKKNWRAIAQTSRSSVVAVASRRREAAEQFVRECSLHTPQRLSVDAMDSYDALLKRSDIDAVYIPLPTGLRKEWILRAAEHGKHILAEKPAAITTEDMEEILDVCRKKGVQFMDGVMFMHSTRLPQLRESLLCPESIGTIRRIACQFSFNGGDEFAKSNIRTDSKLEPFGCLGDLGWYCIRFILWVHCFAMPTRVSGRTLATLQGAGSEDQVPAEFSAELDFPGGSTASFYCSFLTENQQWAHVSGTKGYARLDDFVLPFFGSEVAYEVSQPYFNVQGCSFHMQQHTQRFAVREYDSGFAPAQEINMFETFQKIVESKQLDPTWGDICLQTQQVMNQLYQSAKKQHAE